MKRIQLYLSLTGTACALIGALLLIASVPMLSHTPDLAPTTPAGVVYIGTDGCYTCHIDADSLWTDDIEPRLIDDAVINPHAVAVNPVFPPDALPIGATDNSLLYRVSPIDVPLLTNYQFGSGMSSSNMSQESKP